MTCGRTTCWLNCAYHQDLEEPYHSVVLVRGSTTSFIPRSVNTFRFHRARSILPAGNVLIFERTVNLFTVSIDIMINIIFIIRLCNFPTLAICNRQNIRQHQQKWRHAVKQEKQRFEFEDVFWKNMNESFQLLVQIVHQHSIN